LAAAGVTGPIQAELLPDYCGGFRQVYAVAHCRIMALLCSCTAVRHVAR
jgi:hypothetical protein